MRHDAELIRKAGKVYIVADKSGNTCIVCLTRDDAADLLEQNQGKGLQIIEQDADAFLSANKSKLLTLEVQ